MKKFILVMIIIALLLTGCGATTKTITPVGKVTSIGYSSSIKNVIILAFFTGKTVVVNQILSFVIGTDMEILETTTGRKCIQVAGDGIDYMNRGCWNIY